LVWVSFFPKHFGDLQFALVALTEVLAVDLSNVFCLKAAILFDETVDCHSIVIFIGSLFSAFGAAFKERMDISSTLTTVPFFAF
jgi:hypothetical protein